MKLVDLRGKNLRLVMTGPDILKEVPYIKSIEGHRYSPQEKAWYIPATKKNIDALLALRWRFIGEAYTEILRPNTMEPRSLNKEAHLNTSVLPGAMSPYQVEAIQYIKERHDRAVLAYPAGTGKTLIAIGWLKTFDKPRTLIVCPAFLKSHWQRELMQWAQIKSHVLSGRTPSDIPDNYRTVIINYDILQYWSHHLAGVFDTIVFDESHALINRTSLRTKASSVLADNAKHIVFMTGTPIKSRPLQFWPVLNIIDRKMFKSEEYFANRYCAPMVERGMSVGFKGLANEDELFWLLKHYVAYKSKEELLPNLPPKNRVIYALDVADKKLRELEQAAENATGMDRAKRLMELSHTAYFYKKEFIYELIEDAYEGTGKCIVAAYHKDVLADLKERFPHGVIISGEVPPEHRQAMVDKFQSEGRGLILAQIHAAGVGFTMDSASEMVMAEMVWTPGDMEQMESRIHRKNTVHKQCNYYYTVVSDTIEESMMHTLNVKAEYSSMALTGKKEIFFKDAKKEKKEIN